ncbi:MAG: GspMb/PilO family protein [Candidatus Omnitrophota bacterium]|nr:GspMb/PilO family protein [Candidatus Omnitrophota bacterium]
MELTGSINKYKNIFLNLALVAIAVLFAGKIYKQQNTEIAVLSGNIAEEKKKNVVFENIGRLEKRFRAYQQVAPDEETTNVINTLNAVAKDAGVRLTSIRPAPDQRAPNYSKKFFQLSTSVPSYLALGRFISRLENHQSFFIIENAQINYNGQKQGMDVNLLVSKVVFTE